MAMTIDPADELFVDSSFAIALATPNDEWHEKARELSREIRRLNVRLTTTRAVMLEIGNALSRQRHRASAVRLLHSLENDPRITMIPLSENLYKDAMTLFSSRPDKEWGLVDCASFVVMQQLGLMKALTADLHFEQAGFHALLYDDDR